MRTQGRLALVAVIVIAAFGCERKLDVFSEAGVDHRTVDVATGEARREAAPQDKSNPSAPLKTQWVRTFGGPSEFVTSGIRLDGEGKVYFSARFFGSVKVGQETLGGADQTHQMIAKLDPAQGTLLWARQAGPLDMFSSSGMPTHAILNDGFALDASSGASYISGTFSTSATLGSTVLAPVGKKDIYVAKLDKEGKWLWATSAGGPEDDIAHDITVIPGGVGGGAVVVGDFAGTTLFGSKSVTSRGGPDVFAAHLDLLTGAWTNVLSAGSTSAIVGGGQANDETAVTVADAGQANASVYIGGNSACCSEMAVFGAAGSPQSPGFVAKARLWNFGSPPSWDWVIGLGSMNSRIQALTPDRTTTDLFTAGWRGGQPAEFFEVRAFDTKSLGEKWLFGPYRSPKQSLAFAMAQDVAGDLYAVGYFQGSLELTADGKNNWTAIATDGFLIKLDRQGKLLWGKQVNSPKGANCYGVTTGPDGSVYVTGLFTGQASFDGTSVVGQGSGMDAFVWKLAP